MSSPKTVTVDLETTGLDPWKDKIILISYRVGGFGPVVCIDYQAKDRNEEDLRALRELLSESSNTIRGSNIKFDILFLRVNGFDIRTKPDDTRLLAYSNNPSESLGLKELALSKCGISAEKLIKDGGVEPKKKHIPYFEASPKYVKSAKKFFLKSRFIAYNKKDVELTDRVRGALPASEWYNQVEIPVLELLIETELRGAQIDRDYLERLGYEQEIEIISLQSDLRDYLKDKGIQILNSKGKEVPFNPGSTQQIAQAFTKLGYDLDRWTKKTPTGNPSCDGLFLKRAAWKGDPFAAKMCRIKKLLTLHSTFVIGLLDKLDVNNRLHGAFNQCGGADEDDDEGTATGRLTSSGPNLQNIPARSKEGKKIRQAFIPTPGYVMFDADLKQIEPRVVGHYSQCPKLIRNYQEGVDTHRSFASSMYERGVETITADERFIGKVGALADIYGCFYKKLLYIVEKNSDEKPILAIEPYLSAFDSLSPKQRARLIATSPSEEDAREKQAQWMYFKAVQERFERAEWGIFSWRRALIEQTRKTGYIITFGGRKIKIEGLHAKDEYERAKAERKCVNYKIQGSSTADIVKLVLVRYYNEIVKPGLGHLIAVVHDEILGEFRADLDRDKMLALVKDIMCNTVKLKNIPLDTDAHIIANWAEK